MVETLHSRDRVPVVAAYLSPVVGLPLLGPWVLNATLADDSPAKPHVGRAFDIHLLTLLATIAASIIALPLWGFDAAGIVGGTVLVLGLAASLTLFVGALIGGRWSAPWEPFVLGGRKFYHQDPFSR